MNRIFVSLTVFAALAACSENRQSAQSSLEEINGILAHLDSIIVREYRPAPLSPELESSLEDTVASIMADQSCMQRSRDEALQAWISFKTLCKKGEYEEALNFYLKEDENGARGSAVAVIILLESDGRYKFYSEVLRPLLREYCSDEVALAEYIRALENEKAIEDITISLRTEDSGYVPQVYPVVVMDYGYALAAQGKIDAAFELTGDLMNALLSLSDNIIETNIVGTIYLSQLYLKNGDKESAVKIWEAGKEYVLNNSDDISDEDVLRFVETADNEISEILETE